MTTEGIVIVEGELYIDRQDGERVKVLHVLPKYVVYDWFGPQVLDIEEFNTQHVLESEYEEDRELRKDTLIKRYTQQLKILQQNIQHVKDNEEYACQELI